MNKNRIFSYKIVRDFGFAPNPFNEICTLATCKPKIRKSAQVGDLIIGCGSSKLKLAEKLIYAMVVKEVITFQQYWDDDRFNCKRPNLFANKQMAYGDNIYHLDGNSQWMQEDSHHSFGNGSLNELNLQRDLSVDRVLVSDDFTYFGDKCIDVPNFSSTTETIYPKTRDYKKNFSEVLVNEMFTWYHDLSERGCVGKPISWG